MSENTRVMQRNQKSTPLTETRWVGRHWAYHPPSYIKRRELVRELLKVGKRDPLWVVLSDDEAPSRLSIGDLQALCDLAKEQRRG